MDDQTRELVQRLYRLTEGAQPRPDNRSLPPAPPNSPAWLLRRVLSEDLDWLPPDLRQRVRRARRPIVWRLSIRAASSAIAEIRRRVEAREAPLESILADVARSARDLALIFLRRPSAPEAATRLHRFGRRSVVAIR